MEFERKVSVQAQDGFPAKSDVSEVVEFVRLQRVPGELVITFPGNGGITSVVFKGKPQTHAGEVETV